MKKAMALLASEIIAACFIFLLIVVVFALSPLILVCSTYCAIKDHYDFSHPVGKNKTNKTS